MREITTDVLILGGGIAGLLVTAQAKAAGLSTAVVERSPADRRSGVPHAAQLHNLLGRGRRELDRTLPGLTVQLPRFDGVRARVTADTHVFDAGRRAVERDLGREIWSIPRMRLEDAIRERPETAPDALVEGRAVGLEIQAGECVGGRISTSDGPLLMRSGLTVDAMGASSPVLKWLGADGFEVPRASAEVDQWYATAIVRPASTRTGFVMIFPAAGATRGGLASPQFDGGYAVSVNGIGAVDKPPATATEFVEYARSLPDPVIADLLAGADIARPTLFRRPRASWNRHDLAPMPGLVAVGDASGAPNPLHGQGVSGTAWEARALGAAMVSSPRAESFPPVAGRIRAAVWDLMTLHSPLRTDVPDVLGWERISDHVEREPAAQAALTDVMHLLAPVSTLHTIGRGELPVPAPAGSFWS